MKRLEFWQAHLTRAEAAECGPLGLAVLRGDEQTASYLIDRYPSTCKEVDILGQALVHLVVLQSACLRIILEKSNHSVSKEKDCVRDEALQFAAGYGWVELSPY
ncbi:hypothetical protein GGR57DRAFT_450808 [Xylariaceae sp. FL1272]|nr:hypothetical protein GGR57DRAFT_450808 [Xylariaceae sp. FL1272]